VASAFDDMAEVTPGTWLGWRAHARLFAKRSEKNAFNLGSKCLHQRNILTPMNNVQKAVIIRAAEIA
jgi:hypothetical protein